MALGATIYKVEVNLSNIEANFYETQALVVAQHPSESSTRLAARILAYCLLLPEAVDAELKFGKGINETEEPALAIVDLRGDVCTWVELGTPAPERLHLAAKKCKDVRLFCYKGEQALSRDYQKARIFNGEAIQVYQLQPDLCERVGALLARSSTWDVLVNDGRVYLTIGESQEEFPLQIEGLPS